MTRRLLRVTACLAGGGLVLGALYLALLNVPESTIWMLGLSAALVVLLAAGVVWLHVAATALWLPGEALRSAAASGLRRLPHGTLAMVALIGVWAVAGRLDAWHGAQRGTIDAALMAQFNWAHATWLHRLIDALVFVLRYGVGLSIAFSAIVAALGGGWRALASREWLLRALHPVSWLAIAALVGVFVFVPWQYAYWRPDTLGARVEPAFVALKLGTIALLMATGWALVLRVAVGRRATAMHNEQ